jgi:hypothetical protein
MKKSKTSSVSKKKRSRTDAGLAHRSLPGVKKLLAKLEEHEDVLMVDVEVLRGLHSYLEIRPLLPKTINAEKSRSGINRAQKALGELEARLDRCLAVHDDARTRLRFIMKLEYEVRHVLFRVGFLGEKSSKPALEQALVIVVPELIVIKNEWQDLEVLCRDVHKRVSEAKETIRLMMKLDDNYRWANRGE